jgi:hypothetical protein
VPGDPFQHRENSVEVITCTFGENYPFSFQISRLKKKQRKLVREAIVVVFFFRMTEVIAERTELMFSPFASSTPPFLVTLRFSRDKRVVRSVRLKVTFTVCYVAMGIS